MLEKILLVNIRKIRQILCPIVYLPYKKLNDILAGRVMPTYYEALKKITGVYCLTDISNGKLYIGSATGGEGVAQRWGDYLSTKHGGNVKLKELYKQKGDKYFEKYFTLLLLNTLFYHMILKK